MNFIDCMSCFLADPDTGSIIMKGEIGGHSRGRSHRIYKTIECQETGGQPVLSHLDLSRLNIRSGSNIRVTTRRGSIGLTVRVDNAVPEGMVFIPFCYAEAPANVLTNPVLDPFGKITEYTFCAARVEILEVC